LRAQQGIPHRYKPTKRGIPCRSAPGNDDPKEFFNKLPIVSFAFHTAAKTIHREFFTVHHFAVAFPSPFA
jgi:hypothetical protein